MNDLIGILNHLYEQSENTFNELDEAFKKLDDKIKKINIELSYQVEREIDTNYYKTRNKTIESIQKIDKKINFLQ